MLITYWLHQLDNIQPNHKTPANYTELCEQLRELVPHECAAGLMVKTHSGASWQARFDTSSLAIRGVEQLAALRQAATPFGIQLGAWGEARRQVVEAGGLAGIAASVLGYYALDLEPYAEFDMATIGNSSCGAVAREARAFWRAYYDAGGTPRPGVSIAPQPSGIDPYGDDLAHWFLPASIIHPQCYYLTARQLAPDIAIPYVQSVLARYWLIRDIVPICEEGSLREQLDSGRWDEIGEIDVWRY